MSIVRGYGLDSTNSGQGPVANCCELGNGHLCSIEVGEFLDQPSHYRFFFKKICYVGLVNVFQYYYSV
jgi:hypothetical protein